MFTLSSFKKVLFGITAANASVVFGCFYIFKKNRPPNDTSDKPSEEFRMNVFNSLAEDYDEKSDFIEKMTAINKYKKRNFRKVKGVVLEIGAGSGRNLAFLKNIDALVCVEKSENMCKELKKKIENKKPSYSIYIINNDIIHKLFKPQVFDSVISSFTLCSLEHINDSLRNIYDSMKNDAKFYLVERGIIYNKYLRFILRKFNLYPNNKIPWEYGYYENRDPIQLLKNNNFLVVCKLIKNAGSIYVLTAKKDLTFEKNSLKRNKYKIQTGYEDKETNQKTENNINIVLKKKECQPTKTIHINDIMYNDQIPIYYKYEYTN